MKLDKIIKAVRRDTISELLDNELRSSDYENVILYAEYTISTDAEYRFFRSRQDKDIGELLKDGGIWLERLCSLNQLCFLIDHFLSQYNKKTDDVLVIDIIDYLYSQKI
ncbi:hypothetical protein [Sphingobacterium zeae]|uniref:hypothetical protein n=1 Tax=Sphingobacterium zeae TaxID=1776859 RepID=UPI00361389E2